MILSSVMNVTIAVLLNTARDTKKQTNKEGTSRDRWYKHSTLQGLRLGFEFGLGLELELGSKISVSINVPCRSLRCIVEP